MTRSIIGFVLTLFVSALSGCAKDATGPSDQNCRVYATQFTRQITRPSYVTPLETSTCRFDESSLTLTCEGALSKPPGCLGKLTTVGTYRSVADFVAEASTVGRTSQTRDVESFFASCADSGTGTVNFSYDAQGRLTGRTAVLLDSRIVATYSAWDGSGRPTRGTVDVDPSVGCTLSITYGDGARTMQTTASCASQSTSSTEMITYDANGNIVRIQHSGSGREDSVEVRTIDRTSSVCAAR